MNNILFIGPYRQRDINGITSIALAHNIINGSANRVKLRPLYINGKYSVSKIDKVLHDHEQTPIHTFDTVVQHVPIQQASIINAVNRNILIPINTIDLVDDIDQHLAKFDAILVDNKYDSIRLSQAYPSIQKNIKHIDYAFSVSSKESGTFDLGLINSSEKLYTICDYKLNIRTIYDIIVSFIANLRSKNMSLVLFTTDITAQEKNELESFILQSYKLLGMQHTINRVVVAPITSDLNNIYSAHRSANVFIDAIDYGSNSIHTKIINDLNNSIIKIDPEYVFSLTDGYNNISKNGSLKLSAQAINYGIKKYIENKSTEQNTLLFKTHHINKYI